ncbi:MAG: ABC transporter permease subunit [Planctomycetes bacterium]|nr:ABC transporter permease subunit [Planctomycetota bacterium]
MTIKNLTNLIDPARLIGPIFDKELRVTSRRLRYYLLRFGYIIGLGVILFIVWLSNIAMSSINSTAWQISQLSVMGKNIVIAIVWFQFIASQLLAASLLSSSISDEIYRRTLGILMTTPMNSFHIVTGKLFSRLLQIVILLAVSLPLLALIRVFGGVPWDYLVSSLCITLTAVVFAGSLSLFFSIRTPRSSQAMSGTIAICFLIYLSPLILGYIVGRFFSLSYLPYVKYLFYLNPFYVLSQTTTSMWFIGGILINWQLHCGVMLLLTAGVIYLSMRSVRKVAIKEITGQLQLFQKGKRISWKKAVHSNKSSAKTKRDISRVKGLPIVWKDMQAPLLKGKISQILGAILIIAALLTYYICGIYYSYFDEQAAHMVFILSLLIIGVMLMSSEAAASITKEKETRTWPILLTTPMDDRQIAREKMIAVLREGLPVWILMAGHIIFFSLIGYIHPVLIFQLAIIITGSALFVTAMGLYFSATYRRTSTATSVNTMVVFGVWLFLPGFLGVFLIDSFEFFAVINPIMFAGILSAGSTGADNASQTISQLSYGFDLQDHNFLTATGLLMLFCCIYIFFAYLFFVNACNKFRKTIFGADK